MSNRLNQEREAKLEPKRLKNRFIRNYLEQQKGKENE